jgi:NADH:ubiquinone oxidoreductase subunit 5 (subunit L)/multisubunit Na+/H+ antiporter MnhA subunit
MNDPSQISLVLTGAIILLPALAALSIGTRMLILRAPSERTTSVIALLSGLSSWLLSIALFVLYRRRGAHPLDVDFGNWFSVEGYNFEVELLVDHLSLLMLITSTSIVGLVGRFSVHYLHREPGFHRFFLLMSAFSTGMSLLVLSGSYDLLFAGWEIVGIASMLLIAFFNDRRGPILGAVRAMISYRVADVGLLAAGVLLHEFLGSAEFEHAFHEGVWPHAGTPLDPTGATWVVLALLLAVMGKSAQFPLSGWLPRAMEGPTPSSALFYGALSVHAGVYLLLRSAPLIECSTPASIAIAVVGALSAITATLTGRTQTDAKNILAYATITQVGLMLVGIGLHLWTWVLIHMVAHASLRLLQLLRAPSALRDAQELQAALRGSPRPRPGVGVHLLPDRYLARLYFLARHRFFMDEWMERLLIEPLLGLARGIDKLERKTVEGDVDEPLEDEQATSLSHGGAQ